MGMDIFGVLILSIPCNPYPFGDLCVYPVIATAPSSVHCPIAGAALQAGTGSQDPLSQPLA
jgi:hypothetical protein